jgi:hypothetical protein
LNRKDACQEGLADFGESTQVFASAEQANGTVDCSILRTTIHGGERADLAGSLQLSNTNPLKREERMNSNKDSRRNNPARKELASYFGLAVEIIFRMENYSLIRWCNRESVVATEDLQLVAERRAA